MSSTSSLATELVTTAWLNTEGPLSLDALRGRVVLLTAFQMLCPGCVSHSLQQAQSVHRAFPRTKLAVIGIHTVFEHHAVMNVEALKAFVHEYHLTFPIAVDKPRHGNSVPETMHAYQLRGTPSHVLIDRTGHIRVHHFGRMDDLHMGAALGHLLAEQNAAFDGSLLGSMDNASAHCEPAGCKN